MLRVTSMRHGAALRSPNSCPRRHRTGDLEIPEGSDTQWPLPRQNRKSAPERKSRTWRGRAGGFFPRAKKEEQVQLPLPLLKMPPKPLTVPSTESHTSEELKNHRKT